MSQEQFSRLLSRHKITVRRYAGDHPSVIAYSDRFTTLNLRQKFGEMLRDICAI